jgi:hypothetical protein
MIYDTASFIFKLELLLFISSAYLHIRTLLVLAAKQF